MRRLSSLTPRFNYVWVNINKGRVYTAGTRDHAYPRHKWVIMAQNQDDTLRTPLRGNTEQKAGYQSYVDSKNCGIQVLRCILTARTLTQISQRSHQANSGNFDTSTHGFQRAIKKRTPTAIYYIYKILTSTNISTLGLLWGHYYNAVGEALYDRLDQTQTWPRCSSICPVLNSCEMRHTYQNQNLLIQILQQSATDLSPVAITGPRYGSH